MVIPESDKYENSSMAFSPDSKTLATGGRPAPEVRLWDVATGKSRGRFSTGTAVDSIAYSPDGTRLVAGSGEQVFLFDLIRGRRIVTPSGHQDAVNAVAFSPDGKTLVTGSDDRTLRLWDTSHWVEIYRFPCREYEVKSLSFSPDGKRLAIGCQNSENEFDATVWLWSVRGRRTTRVLQTFRDPETFEERHRLTYPAAFSPDGRFFATGGDREVQVRNGVTGEVVRRFPGTDQLTGAFAFSPDGTTLAAAGEHEVVIFWDLATGQERSRLCGLSVGHGRLVFSPGGGVLATKSYDKFVRLWDVRSGKELRRLVDRRFPSRAIAFRPDGRVLASGGGDTIALWDVATGRELNRLQGHRSMILSLAFSPDGTRLASGSLDATVLIWDVGGAPGLAASPTPAGEIAGRLRRVDTDKR